MDIKEDVQIPSRIDLALKVNGTLYEISVPPTTRLVYLLRDELKLTGTKISCEIGRCGACAVQMNNQLVNSCLIMAYQSNHASIITIEGIAGDDLHPIQQAFLEEGGFQCGYCTPGMIMATKALLESNTAPTEEQIQEALSGNLCRCTGYGGIIRSVQRAIKDSDQKNSARSEVLMIHEVQQLSREEFLLQVGWVFEHSPWVAEKAWESRPFLSKEDLFQKMVKVVENAEVTDQLKLLRAHPDLGTRLKISEVSQKEQASVGLDKLSPNEFREFAFLNEKYVEKFGFPFIMAVKGQNKDSILAAMKERIHSSNDEERMNALNEVYKIAGFRLNDTFQ